MKNEEPYKTPIVFNDSKYERKFVHEIDDENPPLTKDIKKMGEYLYSKGYNIRYSDPDDIGDSVADDANGLTASKPMKVKPEVEYIIWAHFEMPTDEDYEGPYMQYRLPKDDEKSGRLWVRMTILPTGVGADNMIGDDVSIHEDPFNIAHFRIWNSDMIDYLENIFDQYSISHSNKH